MTISMYLDKAKIYSLPPELSALSQEGATCNGAVIMTGIIFYCKLTHVLFLFSVTGQIFSSHLPLSTSSPLAAADAPFSVLLDFPSLNASTSSNYHHNKMFNKDKLTFDTSKS